MGLTSSIVRGRSLKSDSTIREATTGSATTCSVSWHRTAATSWDLSCNYVITAGTGPSTVRSLYSVKRTTTGCWYPGTRVTLVMRSVTSVTTTTWCSPRTTVTTTRGTTMPTRTTALCATAAHSGIMHVPGAASMPFRIVGRTSDGILHRLAISCCSHHVCGWRARSLRWLSRELISTVVTSSVRRTGRSYVTIPINIANWYGLDVQLIGSYLDIYKQLMNDTERLL